MNAVAYRFFCWLDVVAHKLIAFSDSPIAHALHSAAHEGAYRFSPEPELQALRRAEATRKPTWRD